MFCYQNRSLNVGHTLLYLLRLSRTTWAESAGRQTSPTVLIVCPRFSLFSEEKYITIQSYASQGKDEVSFDKGVTVEVIQKNLEGWWFIRWVEGFQCPVSSEKRFANVCLICLHTLIVLFTQPVPHSQLFDSIRPCVHIKWLLHAEKSSKQSMLHPFIHAML